MFSGQRSLSIPHPNSTRAEVSQFFQANDTFLYPMGQQMIRGFTTHSSMTVYSIASVNEQMSQAQCILQRTNSKTVVIDNDRQNRLSTVVKINSELWNTDSDNKNDTDSSYGLSNFGSESDSSDTEVYKPTGVKL